MGRCSGVRRSGVSLSPGIASGLGSREFCEQEGLPLRTFEKWYGRIRRSETSKGKFVEVPTPQGTVGPWAVEVEFPTGVRLRVRG